LKRYFPRCQKKAARTVDNVIIRLVPHRRQKIVEKKEHDEDEGHVKKRKQENERGLCEEKGQESRYLRLEDEAEDES